MGEYDFIIDTIRYSFSSVSTFADCPLNFKLTYIDVLDRAENYYAQFGTLMHLVLEKYFRYELDAPALAPFFQENYLKFVTLTPPPYQYKLIEKNYNLGLKFFDNFSFDRDAYEVLFLEDGIETEYEGIRLIVKPDLVLRDKSTGQIILYDYKTSTPFTPAGKPIKKTLEKYQRQLNLYAFFIHQAKGITIDTMRLWFVKLNRMEEFSYDWVDGFSAVDWFLNTIQGIKAEGAWSANTSEEYMCKVICSMRKICPARK